MRTMKLALSILMMTACSQSDPMDSSDPATSVPDAPTEEVVCEVDVVDGDLFLYNWTDSTSPDLISKFEAEFEVEVVLDTYDSNDTLLAKLQSGAVYDLVVPSDYLVAIMIEEGLLAEVQRDAIPNIGNLMSSFRNPVYDPGGNHSVAYQWGTTGLEIDLAQVGEGFEPSWSLVFDPERVAELPGGVVLLDDSRETLGAALKYLGYSLNTTDESELKEASDVIAGVSADIAGFFDGDSAETPSQSGVAVVHMDSRLRSKGVDTVEEERSYAYVVPREGAALWVDNMAVPANAEHPCTAHVFMNFLLDAENGAALTNWNQNASPNRLAEEFIDPGILEDEAIYPPQEVRDRLELIVDVGEFETRYDDYFAVARG